MKLDLIFDINSSNINIDIRKKINININTNININAKININQKLILENENYVSERNLMETVATNTPPQEFYFEVNQISQSTFDEYIEFVIVDEFCLVDFYINNVANHVLNLPSKPIKIYTSELIKYFQ